MEVSSVPGSAESVLDLIGSTPTLHLNKICKKEELDGNLYAKLENFNPGLSKKDRIAKEMLLDAIKSGQLKPNQTVVELTSGNTGTGLAIVSKALGHKFIAVMSKGNTKERAIMMRAFGAVVELVDQKEGSKPNQVSGEDLELVERRTQQIVEEEEAFRADQFALDSNYLAHYRHTGPELWEATKGNVDVFVDFVGSGGTFSGVSKYLKERNPNIKCYVVEPKSCAVLAGKEVENTSHKIQGGGYNMSTERLKMLDTSLVDGYIQVSDEEAVDCARELASEEGVFGGFSSGANLAAALQVLREKERGKNVAFLVCDSGMKYLTTDLYAANN